MSSFSDWYVPLTRAMIGRQHSITGAHHRCTHHECWGFEKWRNHSRQLGAV